MRMSWAWTGIVAKKTQAAIKDILKKFMQYQGDLGRKNSKKNQFSVFNFQGPNSLHQIPAAEFQLSKSIYHILNCTLIFALFTQGSPSIFRLS